MKDEVNINKITIWHKFISLAISDTCKNRAYFMLLTPDSIWNGRALLKVFEIIEKGYDVILVYTLRADKKQGCDYFIKKFSKDGVQDKDLGPRDIAEIGRLFPHESTKQMICNNNLPINYAEQHHIFYAVDEGYLMAGVAPHPVVIKPIAKKLPNLEDLAYCWPRFTIEDARIYFANDSDEMIQVSFTERLNLIWQDADKYNNAVTALLYAPNSVLKVSYPVLLNNIISNTFVFHWKDISQEKYLSYLEKFNSVRDKYKKNISSAFMKMSENNHLFRERLAKQNLITVIGASSEGEMLIHWLKRNSFHNNNNICWIDNSEKLTGTKKQNMLISSVTKENVENRLVIIASDWYSNIAEQLEKLGVVEEVFYCRFVGLPRWLNILSIKTGDLVLLERDGFFD